MLLVLNRVPSRANLTEAMLAKLAFGRRRRRFLASATAWRSPTSLAEGSASPRRRVEPRGEEIVAAAEEIMRRAR